MSEAVTFKNTDPTGRFTTADVEGNEVVIEGKEFTTSDPYLIRELDEASHAVERVEKRAKRSAESETKDEEA
jgi:hypothetical protein